MAHIEDSERQNPSEQPPSAASSPTTEIGITPFPDEVIVFQEQPDGSHKLCFRGKMTIQGEITIAIRPPVSFKPSESPVPDGETPSNGQLPETTPPPVTEPHSAKEKAAKTPPYKPQPSESKEDENNKYVVTGNPAYDPVSWVTRKNKVPVAQFDLAAHPNPNDPEYTEYWHIRATGERAEKVKAQVRKGQTGVEATVYGPKFWKETDRTKNGTRKPKVVEGYIAGFVHVPKKHRAGQADAQR